MLNLSFEPFPILVTERLVLRRVEPTDLDQVFALRSDPRILPHRVPCQSKEEALAFIEQITEAQSDGDCITWAITLKEERKLIGTVGYWRIKKEHDRAEIGYALLTDYHRRGIMMEALPPVLDYAFRAMQLHSVEGIVDPGNAASIKILERNGFTREGYFKQNFKMPNGVFADSAVYSLLAPVAKSV